MKHWVWGASMLAMAWAAGAVSAQTPAAAKEPLTAITAEQVNGRLQEAAVLLQQGEIGRATALYRSLVNVNNQSRRAQARYGLAVALAQTGDTAAAIKALEGTSADDTELGQAVGELRGKLMLRMAEESLFTKGSAQPWLGDYARLTYQPDNARAARLAALEQAGHGGVLKVGVLLPLSGNMQPVGSDVLRGLQLALEDTPAWRGVRVEMHPADTARGAAAALESLRDVGVDVLVGPLLAANVRDIAAQAVVPVLALSSDRSVAGNGVHVVPPLPAAQARQVARWAVAHGHGKVAALVPAAPYGQDVYEAFREEISQLGGEVVATSFFSPQNVDLGASVRQLVKGNISGTSVVGDVPFSAVFAPVPAAAIPLVTSQLAYYDISAAGNIPLLGTALWQDPAALAPAAKGIQGGVFAAPAHAATFEDGFAASFGHKPNAMAVQGYDIGRLLVQLAAERDWSGRSVAELLLRPEGFYGSAGYLRFQANGLTERGMDTVQVADGTFKVITPALAMLPLPVPANLFPRDDRRWGGWW